MKVFWRVLLALCVLAAGFYVILPNFIKLKYGPSPPARLVRKVKLVDFSYTPASPIEYGTVLSFQVRLNQHVPGVYGPGPVYVELGDAATPLPGRDTSYDYTPFRLLAHDLGHPPDLVADDGIYVCEFAWEGLLPHSVKDLPVSCVLDWGGNYPDQELAGPPLTILPAEDDAE